MIKAKQKLCVGKNKAKDFEGCGQMAYIFSNGLCRNCWGKFILTTEKGKNYLTNTVIPQAKKEVKAKQANETKQKRIENMSKDAYRKKYLQPVINEIIRIIDNGQDCIANQNQEASHAGHFISTGSNRQISLNLHNIHLQNHGSNAHKGGEDLKYYKGLIRKYGQDYADFCDQLRQSKLKHTKQDYIEAFERAKAFRLAIRKKNGIYDAQHRIELRNQGNNFIGLYEPKYSQFKN